MVSNVTSLLRGRIGFHRDDHLYYIVFRYEGMSLTDCAKRFKEIIFQWLETSHGKSFRRRHSFMKTSDDLLLYDDIKNFTGCSTLRNMLRKNGIYSFYVDSFYCQEYLLFSQDDLYL